ncbi:hypothetical protein ATCC90586_004933 [Pythium insidiosum]|nr:hypothetical protein ATCC90586_004933 [Pythium insidiosum]
MTSRSTEYSYNYSSPSTKTPSTEYSYNYSSPSTKARSTEYSYNYSEPSLSPEATVDQKRIHRTGGVPKSSPGSSHRSSGSHAVNVLLTDPDRFSSYRNYAKNYDTDTATDVVSHNTLVKEELVAWVESELGCVVPNAESYSKRELLDLVVVAKSVEQLGAKELDRLYSSGAMKDLQNIALKPYALRRNDKQREYREQSKSKRKDEQHVAHYIGVDVIAQLNKELAPSDRIGEEALGKLVNLPQNMRMVLEKTNLGLHKEVDAILLNKSTVGVALMADEVDRMRQIAKVAQSEAMQQAFIDAGAAKLYDKLRETLSKHDKPGRAKIWDKRRDKEPLRAAPVATRSPPGGAGDVPLKKDGTPDRRYRVNRTSTKDAEPQTKRTPAVSPMPPSPVHLKKDGTPDMRYKENKASAASSAPRPAAPTATPASPPAAVHLKKDGTPDMRYKENKAASSSSSYSAPSMSSSSSSYGGGGGREYFTGPRGGTYYINSNGNKSYV